MECYCERFRLKSKCKLKHTVCFVQERKEMEMFDENEGIEKLKYIVW